VLFDRDGTLVTDVPYNGDPDLVVPMPGAAAAVTALRSLGIPVGVVSNQSGVARGLITRQDVEAVRRRVDGLVGPFAVWAVCPHGPGDGCSCRKPAPGLILAACARLGVRPSRTVVVGDIGSDMEAARAAGARGVLVPTPATLPGEVAAAVETATGLPAVVRMLLMGARGLADAAHQGGAR
jgi:HAD superfamily hydrolase (TIGR01662 family)